MIQLTYVITNTLNVRSKYNVDGQDDRVAIGATSDTIKSNSKDASHKHSSLKMGHDEKAPAPDNKFIGSLSCVVTNTGSSTVNGKQVTKAGNGDTCSIDAGNTHTINFAVNTTDPASSDTEWGFDEVA